jgi:hypothetical protein
MKKIYYKILFVLLTIGVSSCEEFVTQESVSLITSDQVIIDGNSAEAAILGVYSRIQIANLYGTRLIADPGVLSDELTHSGSFPSIAEMDQNNVTSGNNTIDDVWISAFTTLFQANNVLEQLGGGATFSGLTAADQTRILGEARFLRALTVFNLTNLYGPTPIPTTTDIVVLSSISRSSMADVYQFVIDECVLAETELNGVTYAGSTAQFRATSTAAKALRARANLYAGNVSEAGSIANEIINLATYDLADTYASLFQPGPAIDNEIIFGINYNAADQNNIEFQFLPAGRFEFAVSPQLLTTFGQTGVNAFDDARALVALNESEALYYVNKYTDVSTGTDGVIVFRLAEMYLIRAESNLNGSATEKASAVSDINLLRTRAGLTSITVAGLNIDAILNERFAELSFEGHRWYDLRRTGKLVETMTAINADFVENDGLLPVPIIEINLNSNLSPQNSGY